MFPSVDPAARPGLTALLILLLLFCLYNINLRHSSGIDSLPNTLLPASILKEGNIDLNEFQSMLENERRTLRAGFAFGALQEKDGAIISSYPVGAALVVLPVYLVLDLAGFLETLHDYRVAAKVSSSLVSALVAAILFLCLLRLTGYSAAVVITLFFGLGTSMWAVVSQDLWQHGPGMLCLVLAVYCLLRMQDHPTAWLAGCVGIALAMSVICRPTNAIPAVLFAGYMALSYRRQLSLLISCYLPAAVLGGCLIFYNLALYDNLTGGYDAIYHSQWHKSKNYDEIGLYSTPLGFGLASVLLSPNKGLLIFSPYIVFGLAAAGWVLARRRSSFNLVLVGWAVLAILLIAKNTGWYGGAAYGSRYLSESLIPLSLLLGIAWPLLLSHPAVRAVFFTLGIASIAIQMIGVFYWPCGWFEGPPNADRFPERFWDWHAMEIFRCASDGLIDYEIPFEMLNPPPEGKDF